MKSGPVVSTPRPHRSKPHQGAAGPGNVALSSHLTRLTRPPRLPHSRAMANRTAASWQHGSRRRGSSRTLTPGLFGEPDPDDYDTLVSPKTLVNTPRFARGRIKDAIVQVHGIITARLASATRPYDVATEQGMLDEIRAMSRALREGTPDDKRCARLALAATLILLAERDDRPPPPAEGKRAQAASRPKLDLSVEEAA